MKKLTLEDIKPLSEYEKDRADFRRQVIAHKKERRIALGEYVSLVFEDRKTLTFQIQEMMRVEHIYEEEKIREEIDTYNALIPDSGELSATLSIEITEADRVREVLDRLMGIDGERTLYLQVGPQRVAGLFEAGHSKEDKLSAVHYVRFRLTPEQQKDLQNPQVPVTLVMDHPNYKAQATLTEATRLNLAQDLPNL